MYAIVEIAGKQYRVEKGAKLKIDKLNIEVGKTTSFDRVLLTDDGKSINVGQPVVKGASVSAKVLEHGRQRKVTIYKKKRRKGYQRKQGHRQHYSLAEITDIKLSSPKKTAAKGSKSTAKSSKTSPEKKKATEKPSASKEKKSATSSSTKKKDSGSKATSKKESK